MVVLLTFLFIFQSTPSVGRATATATQLAMSVRNFNPRPPWGGRRRCCAMFYLLKRISIHALRGEGDYHAFAGSTISENFNPRPPWGGRLGDSRRYGGRTFISIHALRGEGDTHRLIRVLSFSTFQSTPSVGRATRNNFGLALVIAISIHALRGEGDLQQPAEMRTGKDFNPRPPWGGRPFLKVPVAAVTSEFQSTPSVGRATSFVFLVGD